MEQPNTSKRSVWLVYKKHSMAHTAYTAKMDHNRITVLVSAEMILSETFKPFKSTVEVLNCEKNNGKSDQNFTKCTPDFSSYKTNG